MVVAGVKPGFAIPPMDSSQISADARRTEFRLLKPMPSRQEAAALDSATPPPPPWDTQIRSLFPPRETPASRLPSVQGIQLGHFELEDRIARGGMGTVFLARDLGLDRVVALKVLSQEQLRDPAAVQRFQNEARAAAKLDHENIARVYFVGEDRGVHYIAFEYVRGTTVREAIATQGCLSQDDAVNYTLQAAEALRHLDAAGVVHRDIKPSNLIVTPSGRVKLVDLGLARQMSPAADADLTVTGTTLGTFDYISPEQARDPRNVDIRSDIYSLGCTLYQMLTGSPPYPHGSSVDKLLQHSAGRPPDPAERNPKIAPRLSLVVQRMMSSNPDERYPTPQALIDELADLAEGLGLRASAPEGTIWRQPLYRESAAGWKRHRGWMLAAAAIAILAVFGGEVSRWLNARHSSDPDLLTATAGEAATRPVRPLLPANHAATEPSVPTVGESAGPAAPTPARTVTEVPQEPGTAMGTKIGSVAAAQNAIPPADLPPATGTTLVGPQVPTVAAAVVAGSLPGASQATTPVTVAAVPPFSQTDVPPPATLPRPPNPEPVVGEAPFILRDADGLTTARFQSLEAACHVARNGAVIEIQHDGPLAVLQKPIVIQGKRVTIRPAAGKRPLLRIAPGADSLGSSTARLVEVIDGSLELYDVDLVMEVSQSLFAEEWVLLSLTRAREVILQRVTLTAVNPGWRPAVLVERHLRDDAPVSIMPVVESLRESDIQIRDCLFRGNATAYSDRSLEPAVIRISDSAIGVDADAFSLLGADRADMDGMTRAATSVRIELDHVTAIAGRSLLRVMTETIRDLPDIRFDCRNSILQASSGAAPFVLLEGHQDADTLLQRLRWTGSRNVLVTGTSEPCLARGLYPQGGDDWPYSFAQWQAQWQPEWELESEAITDRQVLTWSPASAVSYGSIQLSDFALRPMSIDEPANPALGTASDSSDRGFRPSLSNLPPSLTTAAGV